jgi:hypothetical protein
MDRETHLNPFHVGSFQIRPQLLEREGKKPPTARRFLLFLRFLAQIRAIYELYAPLHDQIETNVPALSRAARFEVGPGLLTALEFILDAVGRTKRVVPPRIGQERQPK